MGFDRRDAIWQQCLDQLYDSVGHERRLASALGAFMPLLDARGVAFLTIPDVRHPNTSHTGSMGLTEQSLVEYHSHFAVHDVWVLAATRRTDFGPGAVYRGSDLVDRRRLCASYFWNAFLARHNVNDILTGVVEAPTVDGPASFVTFHRRRGQPLFSLEQKLILAELAPHLRHVLRLHRRLAPALALGSTLLEMVHTMAEPVLFVAADGQIVECNSAATLALTNRGGWLRANEGRLSVATAAGWLETRAGMALLDNVGHMVIDLVAEDGRAATLRVHAIRNAATDRLAEHAAWAVCTLTQGARDVASALRKRHGLTEAEARVALRLAQGLTAAEVAAEARVSMPTVRSHIAAALAKMGLRRQAQLVAQLLAM